LIVVVDASGNLLRARTVAVAEIERLMTVEPAAGGGFFVAGWVQPGVGADLDMTVFKLDANLGVVWQRRVGGASWEAPSAVREVAGGLLVGGTVGASALANFDALLVKLGSAGDLLWARTYATGGQDTVTSLWTEGDDIVMVASGGTSSLLMTLEPDGSLPGCADAAMGVATSGLAVSTSNATIVDPGLSGQSLATTPSAVVSQASSYASSSTDRCAP
jgi:hypothetical protein